MIRTLLLLTVTVVVRPLRMQNDRLEAEVLAHVVPAYK
jgi:hypothetical protein